MLEVPNDPGLYHMYNYEATVNLDENGFIEMNAAGNPMNYKHPRV